MLFGNFKLALTGEYWVLSWIWQVVIDGDSYKAKKNAFKTRFSSKNKLYTEWRIE